MMCIKFYLGKVSLKQYGGGGGGLKGKMMGMGGGGGGIKIFPPNPQLNTPVLPRPPPKPGR